MDNSDDDRAPPQELFFRISGASAMWELNRPQAEILELVEEGLFHGNVLDIGCGLGDNAICIATHTNANVVAVDMVSRAIEISKEKAIEAGVLDKNLKFAVVNILEPLDNSTRDLLSEGQFDFVLDSGVFHVFRNDDRLRYVEKLKQLLKPHVGLYVLLVFSEKEKELTERPRLVKQRDLEYLFSKENGWNIESLKDTIIESSSSEYNGQAYLSLIRRI
ncbi:unnamed protein product [Didymodactylos carnosus]|uniref:Methyltransferase domain-containing protein n=1 Tax=Didymodactylos carnosus TaxID=1234261 RepID=A0A814CAI1_9BILA|nr:unnamed protein product [Didymodactylos carnosus]CAF0937413.1 unnamed protein product [Didymodactylos carnosus]CAF3549890.1 unnamed protein product [Didymodactylos carnosus]CAF3714395.1 unnamed protein product [Didymodactylos carnosus]